MIVGEKKCFNDGTKQVRVICTLSVYVYVHTYSLIHSHMYELTNARDTYNTLYSNSNQRLTLGCKYTVMLKV